MITVLKAALHIQTILREVLLLKKSVERVTHILVSAVGEATLPHTRTSSTFFWFISWNQDQSMYLNTFLHCVVQLQLIH